MRHHRSLRFPTAALSRSALLVGFAFVACVAGGCGSSGDTSAGGDDGGGSIPVQDSGGTHHPDATSSPDAGNDGTTGPLGDDGGGDATAISDSGDDVATDAAGDTSATGADGESSEAGGDATADSPSPVADGAADASANDAGGADTGSVADSSATDTGSGGGGDASANDATSNADAANEASTDAGSGCDLTGTWGAKVIVNVSWGGGTSLLTADTGNVELWGLLQGTQSGTTVSGTLQPCGIETPDFQSGLLGETYGTTFPDSLFDHTPPYIPSISSTVTLSGTAPGASYTTPKQAILLGIALTDPTGVWPNLGQAQADQVDMDQDSKPGVTADAKTGATGEGGTYSYPPLALPGLFTPPPRADRLYMALRAVAAFNGTLVSCTQASGAASVASLDDHIIGCHVQGATTDCTSNETTFVDQNRPVFTVNSATFTTTKLSAGAACPDVRAALP